MKYPQKSSKKDLDSAYFDGTNFIENKLGKRRMQKIRIILDKFANDDTSLKKHTVNGKLTAKRNKLHKEIIRRQFKNKNTIDRKDPDLYIFGGLPASAKTTVLGSKVPEKTIVIDSDAYKKKLAHKTRSPLPKYPLAHAGLLHAESDLLIDEALKKAIREKRDVTFDGTMKTPKKSRKLIARFKRAGYDIHYMGTQKKPALALKHASRRFIKKGRLVPLGYIREHGNIISQNSWDARILGDSFQIWDTNTRNPKLVTKSKKGMKYNFRNP